MFNILENELTYSKEPLIMSLSRSGAEASDGLVRSQFPLDVKASRARIGHFRPNLLSSCSINRELINSEYNYMFHASAAALSRTISLVHTVRPAHSNLARRSQPTSPLAEISGTSLTRLNSNFTFFHFLLRH